VDRIRGFAWAVPRALSAAVSACRFEQGDVLYDDPAGYGPWRGAGDAPASIIQVLDPPRSARTPTGDSEGGRFQTSWLLPVTLDLFTAGSDRPDRRATTQGRLFACLWQGDPALLDDATPAPDPPLGLRELQRRVGEAVPAFVSHFAALAHAGRHSLFVVASDDASQSARVKVHGIRTLLEDAFETETATLSPAEAGLTGAELLHPALVLQGFAIATRDTDAIEGRLRALLYGGADESAGRFSLSRHGHLGPLDPDAGQGDGGDGREGGEGGEGEEIDDGAEDGGPG